MHFESCLVESQTKSVEVVLKTPKQPGRHARPWCSCGCVNSHLCKHWWSPRTGTTLPAPSPKCKWGTCLNCLHMDEMSKTDVQDQLYTDKSMTMFPYFNI